LPRPGDLAAPSRSAYAAALPRPGGDLATALPHPSDHAAAPSHPEYLTPSGHYSTSYTAGPFPDATVNLASILNSKEAQTRMVQRASQRSQAM
jgi:hypothetical protein